MSIATSLRNETDAFLQQALQLANSSDIYLERQHLEDTSNDSNESDTITNEIDSFENKIN